MIKSNADYQRDWRGRNAKLIRLHRRMLAALGRLHGRENEHAAWDLAKQLRSCCGSENAAHIARWLQNPEAKRPEIDLTALREALGQLRNSTRKENRK